MVIDMKFYSKLMDALFIAIKYAIAVITAVAIGLMFLETIRRYFFGQQFTWSEEIIRYLFIYVAYVGGAAAFRAKSLVCFDLLSSRFPEKVKRIIDPINNTIVIAFLAFNGWIGLRSCLSRSILKQQSTGLHCSMAIFYAAIPIGCFLMILFALDNYRIFFSKSKEENTP